MAVPTVMNNLSTTAGSNSPAGTDSIGTSLDDYLRATQAILRTTNFKGADIASSTTTDIGAATGEFIDVTGTTTITGLGTIGAGITRTVRFTGALTLTHNATSLILPGAANIQTTANDIAMFRSLGSGNWVCTAYMPGALAPNVLQLNQVGGFHAPVNLSLAATVATNALTIAIKTDSGSDPAANDKVRIPIRNATAATGTYTMRELSAATSITIPDTATMGTTSGNIPFRIWVLWLDDGTDYSIGVVNTLDTTDLQIMRLSAEMTGISPTTIGTGSDSAHVIYGDGSPSSSATVRVLGYVEYQSGLATAGTWASAPTIIQLFGPDVPLPGQMVQFRRSADAAVATGTTVMVADDTIPQSTEGDEYMSRTITPVSPANLLRITHRGYYAHSTTTGSILAALFQDSQANALAAGLAAKAASVNLSTGLMLEFMMRANTVSSTTFKIRAGGVVAGTTTFNGASGGRLFGGKYASSLEIEEIQG